MDRAALEQHIRNTPVVGSPANMRAAFLTLAQAGTVPDLPPQQDVGGCPGRWFGQGGKPIIWLHGGGYVFGGSDSHAAPAQALADLSGRAVFVPDYPLAPEHPWPAQLNAAVAVADAIGPCDLVGDSAGGHLALHLALGRSDLIGTVAVLSPNTDRSGQSTTRARNTVCDLMNDDAQDRRLSDMALGHLRDDDPAASPLYADLGKLPPLFVSATTTEVLLDDSLMLVRAAAQQGVCVTAAILPNLFHMWHLWPDATPQALETLRHVAGHLAETGIR
ncbi:alpha/beta hydrolase [Loktanella salsilacus]|uniref:alpha/beta hydrolase n=1 Tax=Loktanella salsilacus TaxID=195913 RepID=UPI003735C4F8